MLGTSQAHPSRHSAVVARGGGLRLYRALRLLARGAFVSAPRFAVVLPTQNSLWNRDLTQRFLLPLTSLTLPPLLLL